MRKSERMKCKCAESCALLDAARPRAFDDVRNVVGRRLLPDAPQNQNRIKTNHRSDSVTAISALGPLDKSSVASGLGSVLRAILGLGQLPPSLRCRSSFDLHRLCAWRR